MNFPKNSSNHELRSNPVGYVQIRHGFSRIKMCESDKIFVTSIGGYVIVWVWGEVERARETWGRNWRSSMDGVQRLICGDFGEELRRFGLI